MRAINEPLHIGMIGHAYLVRQNMMRFRELDCPIPVVAVPVCHPIQLAALDGLMITGWHYPNVYRRLYPLQRGIDARLEQLSLWGVASGAAALGRNGLIHAIDCSITDTPGRYITTSMLELPESTTGRFTGCFVPKVRFTAPAPNLGILCQNQSRGIVAVRQGNHLASSFVAELTPASYIYQYWLEMVANLKHWDGKTDK